MHVSGSFSWKLGLEGGVLPRRQRHETGPDAPAADTVFELFSLVNADLESAQELRYFIQGRVGEVAAKRRLATPTIAVEETDVPALAEGKRHQDYSIIASSLLQKAWRGRRSKTGTFLR
jgi:hypothetical protein